MSDLYLVLRNRLEAVPEWVFIEPAILRAARERKGFSYETTARELHVASKTYERYEKAGRVPRPLLPKVASLFDLEIEEPTRTPVIAAGSKEERSELLELVRALAQTLSTMDRKLDVDRVAVEQRLIVLQADVREMRAAIGLSPGGGR